ncbi:MAG: alpha/beta fold hydrolase [Acidimicrobiales bacterium]
MTTAAAAHEGAPVDVDGPIAWRELGSGPDTVVFLHGLGLTRTSWDQQLRALADRFRCVAWDMPGYGASDPAVPLTFERIADAVVELLDQLGATTAHLVGLSFGGMHALHTALRHPHRVERLVLLDTSSVFGLDGTDPDSWRRRRLEPLDRGLTPADIARDVLTSVGGPAVEGATLDRLAGSMARISPDGLRAAVECLPSHDVTNRLHEISAPTLVVVGELDRETPIRYSEALAAAIPDARLEILPRVGHLTPAEAPEEVNRLVRSHLESCPDPTGENR